MRQVPHAPVVAFVGLGYVGLSTAVCLSSRGVNVLGIDVDQGKINAIKSGSSPIHEEGLLPLLRRSIRRKTLSVSHEYKGLARARIIFITVGTPSKTDGNIDTEFVESASKEIGRQLSSTKGYRVVVVKSTVTPGTTENLIRPILERESRKKVGKGLGLASNPEFLHEGSAIRETLHPEAVVIGGHDKRSTNTLLGLYESFYKRQFPTILTTPSNAEMVKYAINAGRAIQLSFVNTIADLCAKIPGCDYDEVRKALSLVGRMDDRYLTPGMGFGGSCLPKDSRALAAALRSAGVTDEMVMASMRVNAGQVGEVIRMAERHCGALDGKQVGVLGLSFKPGTDDVRESVSIALVRALVREGSEVRVYDPTAMKNTRLLFGSQVSYAKSARDCITGCECAIIATGWDQFKSLRPKDFQSLMKTPVVIDGRRLYDQGPFRRAGVTIETIGTGPETTGTSMGTGTTGKPARQWHYVVREGEVHSVDGPT